jgi:hypothetical protein
LGDKILSILEGALLEEPLEQKVSDRAYVLKISHYNNKNTDKREQDLGQLDKLVGALPNAFKTEAVISLNKALGMPTPDEAIIIYYDNAKSGDQFRNDNPDIMKLVGRYNDDHLDGHVYYMAKATK